MTQYTLPIQLKCYERLKQYFELLLLDYTENYIGFISAAPEIEAILAEEMQSYGLTPFPCWLVFKKRNTFNQDHTGDMVHLDYTDNHVCNVSLVIPIEGYKDAPMIWYTGDYEVVHLSAEDVSYAIPAWKEGGQINVHREDILGPTFCRVNIPHDTSSNEDGSYRSVVTIRFHGNPTFEEICEKFSNNT